MEYKDEVTLVVTTPDAYGKQTITETHATAATVIIGGIGSTFTNSEDVITADLTVFVDPSDQWVQDNHYRMEEMLVVAPLYGVDQAEAWYEVKEAKPSRDVLLTNQVDTFRLSLRRRSSLGYVS